MPGSFVAGGLITRGELKRGPDFTVCPGGYFLVKDYWGCAAGLGRIFTTGLTIMGLHF